MGVRQQRPGLSRERIIDAALGVAGEVGVDRLSVRKVAASLGVTPMALYKYFNNKDELLAFAFDAFVARANVIPEEDLPWDEWVTEVGRRMFRAICGGVSWVPVLGSAPIGAEAEKVTDAFVRKLTSAGFTAEQAAQAYLAVTQVSVGAACVQSSSADRIDIGLPMIVMAMRQMLDNDASRVAS